MTWGIFFHSVSHSFTHSQNVIKLTCEQRNITEKTNKVRGVYSRKGCLVMVGGDVRHEKDNGFNINL